MNFWRRDRRGKRAKRGSGWGRRLAPAELLEPRCMLAGVVINEFHYDPDVATEQVEFIELYNDSGASVDLSGWRIDEAVDYAFPAGSTLAAGGYLVVTQDAADFQAKFGFAPFGQWEDEDKLKNEGETIELRDAANQLIDTVTYKLGFPWPTSGDYGTSIELINPALDNDLAGNWRSSGLTNPDPSAGTFIEPGSIWRYRKGITANPPADWRLSTFNEASDSVAWQLGAASIGYGDGDDATVLGDMQGNYTSIYLRKQFTIGGSIPDTLNLRLYVDDGAIISINGVEVGRYHAGDGDKDYNDLSGDEFVPEAAWEDIVLTGTSSYLVSGTNTIAVHVLNSSIDSGDLSFNLELSAPANVSAEPTPGAQNSVYAPNAAPQMRQLTQSVQQPTSGQAVTISMKVTDPDGVQSVVLDYQLVDPGNYIRVTDAAFETNWVRVAMHDDGLDGDAVAGDNVYSVVMPGALQTNRRLVRYRVTSTDNLGASVRGPYADDPQPNFAYFVYDGVPDYVGSLRPGVAPNVTYSGDVLDNIATYQLIASATDVQNSQYNPSYNEVLFHGTLVYDGVVYDHIEFRNRGVASTYVVGKNKWKIEFLRGHFFAGRDDYGNLYSELQDEINILPGTNPWWRNDVSTDGTVLFEPVAFKLYELAGTPAPHTNYFQFRVIDDASATGANQYGGDFWGLYMVIEQPDGSFLDERNLPDGNIYNMHGGAFGPTNQRHQGSDSPTDRSDLVAFLNGIDGGYETLAWWEDNVNWDSYFAWNIINHVVNNADIRPNENVNYYRNEETGQWYVVPWDLDLSFEDAPHFGQPVTTRENIRTLLADHPAARLAYENRLREITDLLLANGDAARVVQEFANVLTFGGTDLSIVNANQAQWDYNPQKVKQGIWYQNFNTSLLPSKDFSGLVTYMQNFLSPGGYGYSLLASQGSDAGVPNKPTISYVGAPGYRADGLVFQTTAFSDPQGAGTFGKIEWRVAEVYNSSVAAYEAGQPYTYEIEGTWDSGALTSFSNQISVPASAVEAGKTYRARVRMQDADGHWSHWSDPLEFLAGDAAAPLTLAISEINYNPPDNPNLVDPEDLEFIEVVNYGTESVSLAGVTLTEFISPYVYEFDGSLSLAPGERIVVARDPAVFQSVYGSAIRLAPTGFEFDGKNLSNSGERVVLLGPLGQILSDISYTDDPPWPTAADGSGPSLEIIDPQGPANDAANWRASLANGGSPGTDGTPHFSLPGDYDGNGTVEQADYGIWKSTFSLNVFPFTSADGNGDGHVDAADYTVWRDHLGSALDNLVLAVDSSSIESAQGADTLASEPAAIVAAVSSGALVSAVAATDDASDGNHDGGASLFGTEGLQQDPADASLPASAREVIDFDFGWRFSLGNPYGAANEGFNDSAWEIVQLPHDWAIEGPFGSTGNHETATLPWQGEAWYRKQFVLSADQAGQQVFLDFGGVMAQPRVYVNGQFAGGWDYGYNSFQVDITDFVRFGDVNTIAVYVDTRSHASRWYPGAGIYRKVEMVLTDPVHVGHWGTYVTTPVVSDQSATVHIQTTLENDLATQQTALLLSTIVDPQGNVVATQSQSVLIGAGQSADVEQSVIVVDPQLWDLDTPNLYRVVTQIVIGGSLVDSYVTKFGIRTIEFTVDDGFHLNGERVQIQGVCLHSDLGPLGSAAYARGIERQLEIMKGMGVNAIRTSHNVPAEELLEYADELGLLVFAEVFDKWDSTGDFPADYTNPAVIAAYGEKQIKNFVMRDRNHPSIIVWSVANEEGRIEGNGDGLSIQNMETMVGLFHQYDPTRPVTYAATWTGILDYGLDEVYDVTGFNYGQKYIGALVATPDHPVLASESASAVSTRGYYVLTLPANQADYINSDLQVSSYDLNAVPWGDIADVEFKPLDDHPEVAGEFVWTGFDYLGEPTPYNSTAVSSYFGIVDLVGIPKDRYYLYRSHWNPEETTVHVLPHWNWQGHEGQNVPVFVYTNGDSAELFVNGVSQGMRTKATDQPVEGNLAHGKPTLASSEETSNGNLISNANDGDLFTRWCASSGSTNQWWQVDLGSVQHIGGVNIYWEFTEDRYDYQLQISNNGTSWTTVYDRGGLGQGNKTATAHSFDVNARYVRVRFENLASNPTTWASFYELQVFDQPTPVTYANVTDYYRLRWDNVVYEPGELRVVAYKDGAYLGEETVVTTGAPVSVRLTPDRTELTADGYDLSYLLVESLDANGNVVPTASNLINFDVAGPASIAGVGNGNPQSRAPFVADYSALFNGKTMLIVRTAAGHAGDITVTASSVGLTSSMVTLHSSLAPSGPSQWLAGDYDQNGVVEEADYGVWKSAFGDTVVAFASADGNGDGHVDAADYTVWRDNLGATTDTFNSLVLYVDPTTGDGWLKNESADNLDLIGYGIESTWSSLLPGNGNWNSFADQGIAGWVEAAPSASAISELNSQGMLSFAPGEAIHIGHIFDTSDPLDGLFLTYAYTSSQTLHAMAGATVFAGLPGSLDPPAPGNLMTTATPSVAAAAVAPNTGSASSAAIELAWSEGTIDRGLSRSVALMSGTDRVPHSSWSNSQETSRHPLSPRPGPTSRRFLSTINQLALLEADRQSRMASMRQRDFAFAVDSAIETWTADGDRDEAAELAETLKPAWKFVTTSLRRIQ